jgi:flagellar FliL protein
MANEPTPAAADAPAPSKPKLPVLIGMVAVGLLVGGGTGAIFVGPMVAKKMGKVAPVAAAADGEHAAEDASAEGEHAPADGEAPAEGDGEHAAPKEGEGAAAEGASVHLLENLVLNPAASGGSRFLLLSVAIEVGSPKAGEDFKTRDAELRDIILTALGVKTVDELTEIARREQFKTELKTAINAKFGKKAVKSLYFPQFVVQ